MSASTFAVCWLAVIFVLSERPIRMIQCKWQHIAGHMNYVTFWLGFVANPKEVRKAVKLFLQSQAIVAKNYSVEAQESICSLLNVHISKSDFDAIVKQVLRDRLASWARVMRIFVCFWFRFLKKSVNNGLKLSWAGKRVR